MHGCEWGRSVRPQNRHKRVTNLSKVGLSYWYMRPERAEWRVRRKSSVPRKDCER